jgi:hypothetical protein
MHPSSITLSEIQDLQRTVALYHDTHSNAFGPRRICKQDTCVEGNIAVAWLLYRRVESLIVGSAAKDSNEGVLRQGAGAVHAN